MTRILMWYHIEPYQPYLNPTIRLSSLAVDLAIIWFNSNAKYGSTLHLIMVETNFHNATIQSIKFAR